MPTTSTTPRIGARVLPLDAADRILLLHALDPEDPGHHWWELPGGGLDDGEDLVTAARREVAEESGIMLPDLGRKLWCANPGSAGSATAGEPISSAFCGRIRRARSMQAPFARFNRAKPGRCNVLEVSGEDEVGLVDLPADLLALEAAFSLSPISEHRHLTDGWMNRNWEVATGSGRYVLKRILDVPAATARSVFAAVSLLASRSVPVALPVRTVNGDTVVDLEGRCYCLVPWVEGVHRAGCDLSLPAVTRLGHLVGTIHQALADVPGECGLPPVPDALEVRTTEVATAEELIGHINRIITSIAEPTPYDVTVRALLQRRLELLRGHAHLRPAVTAPVRPFGRIHGDLNIRNLLFCGEEVVAVLDWDRMRVSAYADEVVRTGQVVFGGEAGVLDLERIAAFSAAYQTVMPVDGEALADAVLQLWWKRLTDVWPVEFRYVRGDPSERIAGLFPLGEQVLEWWTRHLEEVREAFADGC